MILDEQNLIAAPLHSDPEVALTVGTMTSTLMVPAVLPL